MTLEEAIEHCEKLSKEQEKEAKECYKYAEEHRQLAEWLIELKKISRKR